MKTFQREEQILLKNEHNLMRFAMQKFQNTQFSNKTTRRQHGKLYKNMIEEKASVKLNEELNLFGAIGVSSNFKLKPTSKAK